MAKSSAERKQDQRNKEKANGEVKVSFTLTAKQAERLDFICASREFSRAEIIPLLIYQDSLMVDELTKDLGLCGRCGKSLPVGCGEEFKGLTGCFKTFDHRELLAFEFTKDRFINDRERILEG